MPDAGNSMFEGPEVERTGCIEEGQAEPPGLGRIWKFIVKDSGRL